MTQLPGKGKGKGKGFPQIRKGLEEWICFVSVAHWHSARWAWNGYQPWLGSIPRPGRI